MDIKRQFPQSNQTLGERIADALHTAAEKKAAAFRTERLYKRTFAQVLLMITDAKNVAEREARALTSPAVIEAEDRWISAQTLWNIAQAEADGLQVRFEEFRTLEATERAKMNLR